MEMGNGEVHEQIAQVFADLVSVDPEQGVETYAAQLNLVQQRLVDLNAITASVDLTGDQVDVRLNSDPLIGGAAIALGAMMQVAMRLTGRDRDDLLPMLREQIDNP